MPRLSRLAVLLLLSLSFSCEDDPSAPVGPDTTAPTVWLVEAVDSYHLRITFSEMVDPKWMSYSSNYSIFVDGSEESVAILSAMLSGRTVELSTSPMSEMRYDLTVKNLEDLQGNTVRNVTATFNGSNRDDRTAPAIAARSPAPGEQNAPLDQAIEVFFSEAVVTSNSDITVTAEGDPASFPRGIIGINGSGHYEIWASLEAATTYTVRISNVVDFAGNPMEPQEWSFKTTSVADTQPPTLVGTYPFNDQTDVSIDAWIFIDFSEMIDTDTFAPVFAPPIDGVMEWWPDGRQFRLRPYGLLPANTQYVITIPAGGFKDVAGNANSEAYTITFTTGSASALLGHDSTRDDAWMAPSAAAR